MHVHLISRLYNLEVRNYILVRKHALALSTRIGNCSQRSFASHPLNYEEHELITNLGSMIDRLKGLVPELLQKSLPKDLLLPQIVLRICPSHFEQINSYLPSIKGHVSYYATCKAAQLLLASLVLNPNAHLHIELFRTSKFSDPSCVYVNSTKIYVRWSTCPDGCSHLLPSNEGENSNNFSSQSHGANTSSTADAKLGSHRWSSIDAVEMFNTLKQSRSISGSLSDLGKGIVGLKKNRYKIERIILGVFIFELNRSNDQILVHTIEDMNIIERDVEESLDDKLRVC